MLNEVFCSIEFVRGLVLLGLGILAAIYLIPIILERMQAKRDKQLAIKLLKHFGFTCIWAMRHSKPPIYGSFNIIRLWKDICEGKREPDLSALKIDGELTRALSKQGKRGDEKMMPKTSAQAYRFFEEDPQIFKAYLSEILNIIYANLEIFELDQLPISHLELARSELDAMSQAGDIEKDSFIGYAKQLTMSFEYFGQYLWKLNNWPSKAAKKQ